MDIRALMKINKDFLKEPENKLNKTVASGWVEVNNVIKFPVNVRRYTDKNSNEEKMFVSYPQRKKAGDTYEDIVRPANKEMRDEIEKKVLEATRYEVTKVFNFPEISSVNVHLLKESRITGTVRVTAMASLTIEGIYINGITVKEGRNGPFVQMPQYKDNNDGTYKDTIYGVTSTVQTAIKDSVLHVYNKELEKSVNTVEQAEVLQEEEKKDIPSIKISKLNYEEKGYLNFVIATEGEELKSRFRIYDPREDENMKLLSVEGRVRHPHIDVLWNSIESSLTEKMYDRYNDLEAAYKNEKILENNPFDHPEIMKTPK